MDPTEIEIYQNEGKKSRKITNYQKEIHKTK